MLRDDERKLAVARRVTESVATCEDAPPFLLWVVVERTPEMFFEYLCQTPDNGFIIDFVSCIGSSDSWKIRIATRYLLGFLIILRVSSQSRRAHVPDPFAPQQKLVGKATRMDVSTLFMSL